MKFLYQGYYQQGILSRDRMGVFIFLLRSTEPLNHYWNKLINFSLYMNIPCPFINKICICLKQLLKYPVTEIMLGWKSQ